MGGKYRIAGQTTESFPGMPDAVDFGCEIPGYCPRAIGMVCWAPESGCSGENPL